MHLRFVISLVCIALVAPAVSLKIKMHLQWMKLVSKNVEAKGGADALQALQSLRLTGKLLVNEGQTSWPISKLRSGRVRSALEATLRV